MILLETQKGRIPKTIAFNAGSTKAEHGISNTKEKADLMMYYAKKNEFMYQPFSQEIWRKNLNKIVFYAHLRENITTDSFGYAKRQLFNRCDATHMYQIYTRNSDGTKIFGDNQYNLNLRNTPDLLKFDVYNIQNIIENAIVEDDKIIITIDYKTLIQASQLIEYLTLKKDISDIPFENIILSIDIANMDIKYYQSLSHIIGELKNLSFGIRLEKVDSKIGDYLWEVSSIDYIKFTDDYWKQAMTDKKKLMSLSERLKLYSQYSDTISVFEFIENEEQATFIRGITPKNSLFSGNYYSGENALILKNK